jgi:HSP20 family molecular chaperone IbpA
MKSIISFMINRLEESRPKKLGNFRGFSIDVDLAGAKKESVELQMGTAGFCVKGDGDDFRYESCYVLAHEVKPTEAKAKLESGLLKIQVPFRETMRGYNVAIEK